GTRNGAPAPPPPLGDHVTADDELGLAVALGEEHRDAPVRPAVRLAHPTEADEADPDASHRGPRALVSGQRGSGAIASQAARIQAYGGSSTVAIVRSGFGPAM